MTFNISHYIVRALITFSFPHMILTLKAVFRDIIQYFFPPTTRTKIIRLAILMIVLIGIGVYTNKGKDIVDSAETLPPVVFVATVSDIDTNQGASFVGTVRAVSEAQIQSERGGQVTSVQVQPGDKVTAGTILASIENSSERAGVLQAEGAYEAALALSAQSAISITDAETALSSAKQNAINTYRNSYTSVYAIVLNDINLYFGNPDSYTTPGVRINTFGNTAYLNTARVALRDTLNNWLQTSNALTQTSNLDSELDSARENVHSVIDMIDILVVATRKASDTDTLDGRLVTSYTSDLNTARATLNATLNTLTSAKTALSNARENLDRAKIGGSQNTDTSLANAQVKQALGVLRNAQANYEKTIFRSPISGTVNSMRIHVGDYISPNTFIGEVANNNALQISIFVGEADIDRFSVGNTVHINNTAEGTVTSVAPAIDSVTQKTEVKIATESSNFTNGSTVTVTAKRQPFTTDNTPLIVPITAVKFTATTGSLFVVEDGVLVARPVTIGDISGAGVTIIEGLDKDTIFVIDARGLSAGQHVEAKRKE